MNVTIQINGNATTLPLAELATMLVSYPCDTGYCTTDVASSRALDTFYLLVGAILVFFMQVGFCFLEVGCVHTKNTKNILIKNILDPCIAAICFYLVGYAFGLLGGDGFIGNSGFVFRDDSFKASDNGRLYNGKAYASWLFQWAFAAAASTIVTGAVAERIAFIAYVSYAVAITAFIYPVVVHWLWSSTGFASPTNATKLLFDVGAIDFAGSGVVHMTGGMAALVGCCILGPRVGRFQNGEANDMPKQSVFLQTIGTLLLWFGWYGFNCMSTGTLLGNAADVTAKVAVNLTLTAAAAGIGCVFLGSFIGDRIVDPTLANNGVLAGAVSITAGCSVVEPSGAVAIGFIAAILYTFSSKLLVKLKIDDVVDAVPVHLVCGAWGVIAIGFFASNDGMQAAYSHDSCGVFYGCSNGGKQLGAQVVVVLAIAAWVGVTATILFGILHYFKMLRVSPETELAGLDISLHGGYAYYFSDLVKTDGTNGDFQNTTTPVANSGIAAEV
ncbi:unnamed protein product [Aphanomyces euteiches]